MYAGFFLIRRDILLFYHLNQLCWIAADDGIGGHIFRDHSCSTFSFYYVSVLLPPHAGYSLVIRIANHTKRTRVHVFARSSIFVYE